MMSGSIQKKINRENLKKTPALIPSKSLLDSINPILGSFYTKKFELNKENIQLTKLRNWLPPMLMNGQITVTSSTQSKAKEA